MLSINNKKETFYIHTRIINLANISFYLYLNKFIIKNNRDTKYIKKQNENLFINIINNNINNKPWYNHIKLFILYIILNIEFFHYFFKI